MLNLNKCDTKIDITSPKQNAQKILHHLIKNNNIFIFLSDKISH